MTIFSSWLEKLRISLIHCPSSPVLGRRPSAPSSISSGGSLHHHQGTTWPTKPGIFLCSLDQLPGPEAFLHCGIAPLTTPRLLLHSSYCVTKMCLDTVARIMWLEQYTTDARAVDVWDGPWNTMRSCGRCWQGCGKGVWGVIGEMAVDSNSPRHRFDYCQRSFALSLPLSNAHPVRWFDESFRLCFMLCSGEITL